MGLLTQALAGGVAAAADTTASIMVDNAKAARQSERDQANAMREENLLRLRETLQQQSSDREFTRNQGAELAKEERTFSRGESGMVDAEGVPLTRAQAEAIKKQDAAAAEAGPVKPGLISAAKYTEENTISKDYVDPDGKPITVAEAKYRQKNGQPLKLREDVEHERTRKEKGEDREKDLKDYKKKKDIDVAGDIKKENAKPKEQKETDAVRSGPTIRYIKAGKVRKSDGTVGPGTMAFNMSDPAQRKMFSQWVTGGQGVEVFAGEAKTEDTETGAVTKTKTAPGGLAQPKAANGTRFTIKSVK